MGVSRVVKVMETKCESRTLDGGAWRPFEWINEPKNNRCRCGDTIEQLSIVITSFESKWSLRFVLGQPLPESSNWLTDATWPAAGHKLQFTVSGSALAK